MTPSDSNVRDLLALHLVPGLGPRLTAALLERFGSAAAVLRAGPGQLSQVPHIGTRLATMLADAMRQVDVDAELERTKRAGVRLLALGSPDYPAALAEIHDPPHLLFLRGSLQASDANAIAIVGSRHCTSYGKKMAERLAADLARAGCTVVSGLARGIDGAAHRAALDAGGRTIAVLAGGLSSIYPPEHSELAEAITGAGALVTESSMQQQPLPNTFPPRNRIISGLSRAVVLVEAAERSGALITAEHAAEQGRIAMAVPGPVDQPASAGTNALIRQGAILVRGVDDILEELQGMARSTADRGQKSQASLFPAERPAPSGLDATQLRLWEFLAGQPRHLDEMVQQLGLSVAQLSGLLLGLEMKRIVRRLPGNRYERC
jgi:DNA processing protein